MFLQRQTSKANVALKSLLVPTKLYTDTKHYFTAPIFRAFFDTESDKELTVSCTSHSHILYYDDTSPTTALDVRVKWDTP